MYAVLCCVVCRCWFVLLCVLACCARFSEKRKVDHSSGMSITALLMLQGDYCGIELHRAASCVLLLCLCVLARVLRCCGLGWRHGACCVFVSYSINVPVLLT